MSGFKQNCERCYKEIRPGREVAMALHRPTGIWYRVKELTEEQTMDPDYEGFIMGADCAAQAARGR